jgi:DNA-binding response OmpR family regulator
MRSRFNCLLLDAGPGRLEPVADVLVASGVDVERVPLTAAADCPPAEATVVFADAKDAAAVDLLRRVVTPAWLRTRALVVLARVGDSATISRAVAMGADDAACTPLDEQELLERLDFAATFARARAEAEARDEILAAFRGGPAPAVPHLGPTSATAGASV